MFDDFDLYETCEEFYNEESYHDGMFWEYEQDYEEF